MVMSCVWFPGGVLQGLIFFGGLGSLVRVFFLQAVGYMNREFCIQLLRCGAYSMGVESQLCIAEPLSLSGVF